jgi:transmembrane sensor
MPEPTSGSSPELRTPLSRELHDPVNEPQLARMWREIEARRAGSASSPNRMLVWAAIGAVLGAFAVLGVESLRGNPKAPPPITTEHVGPLSLFGGGPIPIIEVPQNGAHSVVVFSDGSRLDVAPSARIEPLASTATDVVFRLVRGRVLFDVVPGGPRRFRIEAGIASVEVVGTRFVVDRAPERVRVEVERGVVLVRGATVPDGVSRVEAGASIDVRTVTTPAPSTESAPVVDAGSAILVKQVAGRQAWRESANHGRYAEAYVSLGRGGVERETARADSVEELLALADVARLSGHPAEAVDPLERLLRDHASSPSAALSALTLGRIELSLERPGDAAKALERALTLGVPEGLEEDVYARLVEAYARSGNAAAAAALARDYQRRFPAGRRAADVLRWGAP